MDTRFISITAENGEGHIRFTFAGRYDFLDCCAIVRGLRKECARNGMDRAVLDIRNVEGDVPGHERYELGVRFADELGGRLRAAILSPFDRLDSEFENVPVSGDAQVMVCHDEAILMQWLMAVD
jgi:hypothetical protein